MPCVIIILIIGLTLYNHSDNIIINMSMALLLLFILIYQTLFPTPVGNNL